MKKIFVLLFELILLIGINGCGTPQLAYYRDQTIIRTYDVNGNMLSERMNDVYDIRIPIRRDPFRNAYWGPVYPYNYTRYNSYDDSYFQRSWHSW